VAQAAQRDARGEPSVAVPLPPTNHSGGNTQTDLNTLALTGPTSGYSAAALDASNAAAAVNDGDVEAQAEEDPQRRARQERSAARRARSLADGESRLQSIQDTAAASSGGGSGVEGEESL